MNRRELLAAAAALAVGPLGGRLWAAPASASRFLLVFLRGGYDCANLLIPYSSVDYYALRPHIAIARPDPNAATGALARAGFVLAPVAIFLAAVLTLGPIFVLFVKSIITVHPLPERLARERMER